MELQKIIDYCTAKKGVTNEFPFGDDILVFKVMGKMFGLLMLNPPHSMNLKCDPVYAMALRQKYLGVRGGYHMNKKHWNTVDLNSDVPVDDFFSMIDDSYDLVVQRLTRTQQEKLV
jgi:predicted DNA-binding protein (MmcQ/YjbR family)